MDILLYALAVLAMPVGALVIAHIVTRQTKRMLAETQQGNPARQRRPAR